MAASSKPKRAGWLEYLTMWAMPEFEIDDNGYIVWKDTKLPVSEAEWHHNSTGIGNVSREELQEISEQNLLDKFSFENPVWNSLSDSEKLAILKSYGSSVDPEHIKGHLEELEAIGDFGYATPVMSDFVKSSEDIYANVDNYLNPVYDAERSRLDAEINDMREDYRDQLRTSADMYSRQASGLLSNQYLANAQTYDALQSDLRKSRQNALEAGASAGIRLAGNVNALLTAQNKQSQTAMDTSNALAEMLLQQRNAAAGIRSDYRGYMSNANQRRSDIDARQRTERESLYNTIYDSQLNDYNRAMTDYDTRKTEYEDKFTRLSPGNRLSSYAQAYYANN